MKTKSPKYAERLIDLPPQSELDEDIEQFVAQQYSNIELSLLAPNKEKLLAKTITQEFLASFKPTKNSYRYRLRKFNEQRFDANF